MTHLDQYIQKLEAKDNLKEEQKFYVFMRFPSSYKPEEVYYCFHEVSKQVQEYFQKLSTCPGVLSMSQIKGVYHLSINPRTHLEISEIVLRDLRDLGYEGGYTQEKDVPAKVKPIEPCRLIHYDRDFFQSRDQYKGSAEVAYIPTVFINGSPSNQVSEAASYLGVHVSNIIEVNTQELFDPTGKAYEQG